jgi:spore coat polysaccharide biosynthesis predicted glycosyltransferase SpsG
VIAVVADGGPAAGLGHLGRSTAIAAALRARGLEVTCCAYGASAPVRIDGVEWTPGTASGDLLVLDSYTMPAAERDALAAGSPLVSMHDHGGRPPGAALVVTVGGEPGPRTLAGLRYAPLRAPFWGLPPRAVAAEARRVLVTTGGGALQDAGVAIAREATAAFAEVALVRGPYAEFEAPDGVELIDAPPVLLEHLLAADVVITAAGQTALESAATGAATVAIPFVDNQRRQAARLAGAGAAVAAEPDAAVAAAASLDRAALARAGQAAIDGYGALRIAFAIAALL